MKSYQKIILAILTVLIVVTASSVIFSLIRNRNDDLIEESMREVAALPDRTVASVQEDESDTDNSFGDTPNFSPTEEVDEDPIAPTEPESLPSTNNEPDPEPIETPTTQPEPSVDRTIKSGIFESVADYETNGSVSFEFKNGQYTLDFGEDFSFSGAPDPVIYLCPEKNPTRVDTCQILGALQSNNGFQSWQLSQEEAEQYNNVIVWCRAFNLLMGTSELT